MLQNRIQLWGYYDAGDEHLGLIKRMFSSCGQPRQTGSWMVWNLVVDLTDRRTLLFYVDTHIEIIYLYLITY